MRMVCEHKCVRVKVCACVSPSWMHTTYYHYHYHYHYHHHQEHLMLESIRGDETVYLHCPLLSNAMAARLSLQIVLTVVCVCVCVCACVCGTHGEWCEKWRVGWCDATTQTCE
jgi:hypothetical protein